MLITDQTHADVPALDARLTGSAYGPGDAGYDEGRQGFVLSIDHRPAVVALPETAEDVVAIVEFARDHGLRIAPQGTGHNAHPIGSLADAILLKTSRMRGVEIDAERRVARVEAGAWWIDVTAPASDLGLAPLMGSSPDVGVVGYTLGGGVSWLARKHGLGANNVHAIEVVTPDGRHVRADHVHEPDLFWALRGGGGSFGVVTAMEIALFPMDEVFGGVLFFPAERSREVLKAWVAWTKDVPDEVTSIGRVLNVPPMPEIPDFLRGKSFVTVEAVFLGDEEEGRRILEPLRALGPEIDTFAMMPPAALSQLHMDPEGAVPAAISDHQILDRLDDAGIDAFVDLVGPGSGAPLVMAELRHVGGALHRSHPRHGVIDTLPGEFLSFAVGIPFDEALAAAITTHLGVVRSALAPYDTQRTYLNFTEKRTDPAEFYGTANYVRLRAVKAEVDPHERLVSNHPIRPS